MMTEHSTPEAPSPLTADIEHLHRAAGHLAAEASQLALAARHPDAERLPNAVGRMVRETAEALREAAESVDRMGDHIRSAAITAALEEQEQNRLTE